MYFYDGTSFIDGRQIQLTLLDGSLSYGGLSTSVQITPVSTRTETVTISNAPGEQLSINIATDLTAAEFADAIGVEYNSTTSLVVEENTTIEQIDERTDGLRIYLKDNEYELSIAKVRVGPAAVSEPGPHYITDVAGNETSVPENTTHRFTVAVRDRYNNPVSGVPVITTPTNADLFGTVEPVDTPLTGSDGRTTFRYTAPLTQEADDDGNQDVWIRTSIDGGKDTGNSTDLLKNATFHLTVIDTDQSGSQPGNASDDGVSRINPGTDAIRLVDAQMAVPDDTDPDKNENTNITGSPNSTFYLTFESVVDQQKELEFGRLLFHMPNNKDVESFNVTQYTSPYLKDSQGNVTWYNVIDSNAMEMYRDYVKLAPNSTQSIIVPPGEQVTVGFEYSGSSIQKDLFGISILFADETRSNYFVYVPAAE
ncbi:Ig-like domain-containing protein [Halapricum desulfuricans]|nr:Ig-like domain-containing protein [Halapricum desulfuricans]